MERHDTHALSGYSSSSNNHSYDFENKKKNKNNKKLISRNIQDGLNEQLTSIQLKKINSILNKYNIHSEQTPKNVEFIKHRQKTDKEEEINLNRNILISKNFYQFLKRIIVLILNKGDEKYLTIRSFIILEIQELIAIISNMIYIETIELRFLNLDYELKKSIKKRGEKEVELALAGENNIRNESEILE